MPFRSPSSRQALTLELFSSLLRSNPRLQLALTAPLANTGGGAAPFANTAGGAGVLSNTEVGPTTIVGGLANSDGLANTAGVLRLTADEGGGGATADSAVAVSRIALDALSGTHIYIYVYICIYINIYRYIYIYIYVYTHTHTPTHTHTHTYTHAHTHTHTHSRTREGATRTVAQ